MHAANLIKRYSILITESLRWAMSRHCGKINQEVYIIAHRRQIGDSWSLKVLLI